VGKRKGACGGAQCSSRHPCFIWVAKLEESRDLFKAGPGLFS